MRAPYSVVGWLDMLKVDGRAYTLAVGALSNLHGVTSALMEMRGDAQRQLPSPDETRKQAREYLELLQEQCRILGVDLTLDSIDRMLRLLEGSRQEDFAVMLEHIDSRLCDELKRKHLFVLDSRHAELFTNTAFQSDVFAAFPKAVEDIEEAGKCLSLGRFTASVFHLMRAMECAVQALAAKLSLPKVDKEWGKLLSELHQKIEAMPKSTDRDLWSESHAHLYHVKQAWRNDVMHPKETYTEEQATEVYSAVRSFMRHLAALV